METKGVDVKALLQAHAEYKKDREKICKFYDDAYRQKGELVEKLERLYNEKNLLHAQKTALLNRLTPDNAQEILAGLQKLTTEDEQTKSAIVVLEKTRDSNALLFKQVWDRFNSPETLQKMQSAMQKCRLPVVEALDKVLSNLQAGSRVWRFDNNDEKNIRVYPDVIVTVVRDSNSEGPYTAVSFKQGSSASWRFPLNYVYSWTGKQTQTPIIWPVNPAWDEVTNKLVLDALMDKPVLHIIEPDSDQEDD